MITQIHRNVFSEVKLVFQPGLDFNLQLLHIVFVVKCLIH